MKHRQHDLDLLKEVHLTKDRQQHCQLHLTYTELHVTARPKHSTNIPKVDS